MALRFHLSRFDVARNYKRYKMPRQMIHRKFYSFCMVVAFLAIMEANATAINSPSASTLNLQASIPLPIEFVNQGALGMPTNPQTNTTMSLDSYSLFENSARVYRVQGSMHYARVPQADWDSALAAMRSNGMSAVQTYIFWIHHEEIENDYNWSGRRNLTAFLEAAHRHKLRVFLRLGPWSHGECRFGGFPNWLVAKPGIKLRSNNPIYLAAVKRWIAEVSKQVDGYFWHQGGPIDFIQIENEFKDVSHLETLRSMARNASLIPAYYTKTKWPVDTAPFGEFIPFVGGYEGAFWSRNTTPDPPSPTLLYKQTFNTTRTPIQPSVFGVENGGGMNVAYHRREKISWADVGSGAVTAVGSGQSLLGYYIFRGGVNPHGQLNTLAESQTSGVNDLPPFSYDYYAPLSQWNVRRRHYYTLGKLHYFVTSHYGKSLLTWPSRLPQVTPPNANDNTTLRWSFRGTSINQNNTQLWNDNNNSNNNKVQGYIFVTNHVNNLNMTTHNGVRFHFLVNSTTDPTKAVDVIVPPPSMPALTIGAGAFGVFPVGIDLSTRSTITQPCHLAFASAQLISSTQLDSNQRLHVFSHLESSKHSDSSFPDGSLSVGIRDDGQKILFPTTENQQTSSTQVKRVDGLIVATEHESGLVVQQTERKASWDASPMFQVQDKTGVLDTILVLPTDVRVWSFPRPEIVDESLFFSEDIDVELAEPERATDGKNTSSLHLKALLEVNCSVAQPSQSRPLWVAATAGSFVSPTTNSQTPFIEKRDMSFSETPQIIVKWNVTKKASAPRQVNLGPAKVAQQPNETDWLGAQVWNLTLSMEPSAAIAALELPRLVVQYVGDAARLRWPGGGVTVNASSVVNDNFYNGRSFETAVPSELLEKNQNLVLELEILPLSKTSPIFLPQWPTFSADSSSTLQLQRIDVFGRLSATGTF